MKQQPTAQTLIERTAEVIRQKIITGDLLPGAHLSEAALSEQLNISRNTLREVFRLLTQERLLRHEVNRGVQVALPDMAAVLDIYRVRRLIECDALAHACPLHPALARMEMAVQQARHWQLQGEWRLVGTENMAFHAAIAELSDSERLIRLFRHISAELRLAFHLHDHEMLHVPYIEKNAEILTLLHKKQNSKAVQAMKSYLEQSERTLLAALTRQQSDNAARPPCW